MTKEQQQKKALAEATILTLYKKYGHKKKETATKAVSFFLLRKNSIKNIDRRWKLWGDSKNNIEH